MEVYLCHTAIFRILEKTGLNRVCDIEVVNYIAATLITLIGAITFASVFRWGLTKIKRRQQKMTIFQLKNRLRETFVYDIYSVIKYKLYPYRLRRAGVEAGRPEGSAVSDKLLDGKQVIVSLTTFPARIKMIERCLCSLMNQEYKPNKIILWLAEPQFPNREGDIPKEVLELRENGLEIRWVERDIRSYKKLVPALKEFPSDIIVTADDDLYYPKDWLKKLIDAYLKDNKSIHCHIITRVEVKENKICTDYKEKTKELDLPSFHNQILGVSGSLFPPNSLFPDVINEDLFMELAPTNDDVWFWAMAILNGVKIHHIQNGLDIKKLIYIEGTQENTPCLTAVNINPSGERLIESARENINKRYDLIKILRSE